MTICHSKKRNKEREKAFLGETYITDGKRLTQTEIKQKIFKHLNQDITETGYIK
jgi:hypothetical protein